MLNWTEHGISSAHKNEMLKNKKIKKSFFQTLRSDAVIIMLIKVKMLSWDVHEQSF